MSNIVNSMSPTMKYSPRYLFDVELRIVVAPVGQRVGEGEGGYILRCLDVTERPADNLHVNRTLAHGHPKLVDDVAFNVGRMLVAVR